jgi:hypothetical protein
MTGLELMALQKMIQGGANAYSGGKDWLLGDPASKSENAMIKSLKERMSTDLISKGKLQEMLIRSGRVPQQQLSSVIDKSRGATAFTGMDDSVVANQIGVQEVAKTTDDIATQSLRTTERVGETNRQDKRVAEEKQFALKQMIEQRDKDARSAGFDKMIGGFSGMAETGGQYQNLAGGGGTNPNPGNNPQHPYLTPSDDNSEILRMLKEWKK